MQISTLEREKAQPARASLPHNIAKRTRLMWLWLIPLLLITMWLGARGLNADGYWVDEVWSLRTAGGPTFGPLSLAESWQRIAIEDAWQAPGFYLLLNVWGSVVGWSELATRTISLLFGVLSIAMMYRLAKDTHSALAGVAAAVALATSAFYVNFYHELRGYTLYIFLTALCVWSYWRLIQQPLSPTLTPCEQVRLAERGSKASLGLQAAFALSVAGLLYTHYFASLTVIILGLYHFLFVQIDLKRWRDWRMWLRWGNRDWWRIGLLTAAGALLFVPWMSVLLFATRLAQEFPRYTLPPDVFIQSIINSFSNNNLLLVVALAVATVSFRGRSQASNPSPQPPPHFVERGRNAGVRADKGTLFAWVYVLGWFVIGLIACYLLIMGEVRYLLGIWVALALLCGVGVAQLARRGVRAELLIGGWLIINVWNIYNSGATGNVHWSGWHEPFRELAQVMDGYLRVGDTLFYQLEESVNAWYQEDVVNYYLNQTPARVVLFEAQLNVPYTTYTAQAHDQVNGAIRVWLAADPTARPWRTDMLHETFIESGLTPCGNFASLRNLTVDLYVNLPFASPSVSYTEPLQNGVLGTAILEPLPQVAGNSLPVVLGWWQDANVPAQTYSAALHVLDAGGNLVAQDDYALDTGAATCRISRLGLAALPAGEYSLALVVYNWQTSERLAGADGERTIIGTFQKNSNEQ